MRATFVFAFLLCFTLPPSTAAAQGFACGGHRIEWIGGAPGLFYDAPHAADAGRGIHGPPVRTEPAGVDRTLWDALVFNAYDHPTPDSEYPDSMGGLPLEERWTVVMKRSTVPTIKICIQSADESFTGERLAPYAQPEWWTRNIRRFTNTSWSGSIRVSDCKGEPPAGWVYVWEGDEGEVSATALAHANSWRFGSHGRFGGRWARSEIVWNPDHVRDMTRNDDDYFETTLAHELGHVLGLWHTPKGSGFVMTQGEDSPFPDNERWLAQWAYHVGPNVQYPGLCRDPGGCQETPVPALPLVGVLLLAGTLLLIRLRS